MDAPFRRITEQNSEKVNWLVTILKLLLAYLFKDLVVENRIR